MCLLIGWNYLNRQHTYVMRRKQHSFEWLIYMDDRYRSRYNNHNHRIYKLLSFCIIDIRLGLNIWSMCYSQHNIHSHKICKLTSLGRMNTLGWISYTANINLNCQVGILTHTRDITKENIMNNHQIYYYTTNIWDSNW